MNSTWVNLKSMIDLESTRINDLLEKKTVSFKLDDQEKKVPEKKYGKYQYALIEGEHYPEEELVWSKFKYDSS